MAPKATTRDISPPSTKRRRLNETESSTDVLEETNSRMAQSPELRIHSWNINGVQPFLQKQITSFFSSADKKTLSSRSEANSTALPKASLRDFLRRHGYPTMLCLQEVKINPDDSATIRAVERAVAAPKGSTEPDYRAYFCLPTDKHNARGFGRKVYGVCTIVRSEFLYARGARVRTVDWDLEGRFQIVEIAASATMPKLSIWNIYAVNGTENPYRDPSTGEVVGTRHDRKLAVHKLMLEECKRLESEGYAVILAGDLNIARGLLDGFPNLRTFPEQHVRNRADFNKAFFDHETGLRAVDTFRHLHGDERSYTYFPRGGPFGYSADRVDLIICSNSIAKDLVSAGMLDSPAERGPSDHCPLYAAFFFRPQDGNIDYHGRKTDEKVSPG